MAGVSKEIREAQDWLSYLQHQGVSVFAAKLVNENMELIKQMGGNRINTIGGDEE